MNRFVIVAVGFFALALLALSLDWHLYIFNRKAFLINKMATVCAKAEMARSDYQECKAGGNGGFCYWALSDSVRLEGECNAANAAINAEHYRLLFNEFQNKGDTSKSPK